MITHDTQISDDDMKTKDLETISKSAKQLKMSVDPDRKIQCHQKHTILPHFLIILQFLKV